VKREEKKQSHTKEVRSEGKKKAKSHEGNAK
jgi:hypothetical protein